MTSDKMPADRNRASALTRELAQKVPTIAALFWLVKLLTTGMGEAASDALAELSPAIAVGAATIGIAAALTIQFRAREYSASKYWFAVAMVAVFGTMAADAPHLVGVPLTAVTATYAAALAAWFGLWWHVERTLDVHSITTRRREVFYWGAVLLTFALGTALGDWSADYLDLGFGGSAVIFACLIAIPAVWCRFGGLNPIVAFWAAYVMTRPLGASIADWLGKPSPRGLGIGDDVVAVTAAVATAVIVVVLARTGFDDPQGDRRLVSGPSLSPTVE